MSPVVEIVVWSITAWSVGEQVLRAWSRGAFAARNRFVLVRSTVDAVVLLAATRAVLPPPGLLSWAWVAAVVAVGFGVAGAILRWAELDWTAPDAAGQPVRRVPRPGRRAADVYVAVGACLLVALV